MPTDPTASRRQFIQVSAITGSGLLIGSYAAADDKSNPPANGDKKEEDVSPSEDLMREHGLLKRVMMIYDEIARRIEAKRDFPPQTLVQSADIIRRFVEDYHEKLEEDHLFPRFRKANKLVDLVDVLMTQHQAGRRVTEIIIRNAAVKEADQKQQVVRAIQEFNRMYAPHEAREDTVLFPAFHELVSQHEYDALGEDFEKKENELFGQEGFEHMVDKVAGIEKELGIYDLSQFTPKV